MSYTVVDDGDTIQVRASIDRNKQQDELRALIAALEKRLPKEPLHERSSDL